MFDPSNIDQKKITQLTEQIEKLTKESHNVLSKPIIESIPKMFLDAKDVAQNVGGQITSVQKTALGSINSIFSSILEHEKNVQKHQASEKPSDFVKTPIPDLREKIATGFPREDPAFFTEIIPSVKF